jgi:hypothetical protein
VKLEFVYFFKKNKRRRRKKMGQTNSSEEKSVDQKTEEEPEVFNIEKNLIAEKKPTLLILSTNENDLEKVKALVSEINHHTITPLENYFKVFSKSSTLENIDYLKITLEKVRCSISRSNGGKSRNMNKCRMKIHLNSSDPQEAFIIECFRLIELQISLLTSAASVEKSTEKSVAALILKEEEKKGEYSLKVMFPSVVSDKNINYKTVESLIETSSTFVSTVSITLIRCDWISGGVLPRFVLTSAF